jgi:ferric iron reductase protein FhuF
VAPAPGGGDPTVRRHTCCLAFTEPEPKICSGCPLPLPAG